MEIRPATEADREAIRTVARAAWHEAYDLPEGTIEETVAEWYGDLALERAVSKPGTAFLVADDDGEVVGFVHGVVVDDEGDVLRIAVHPDRQGEGIGTALYERLRESLEDFNMRRIRAMDFASNEQGRAFFETHGFERTDVAEVDVGGESRREAVYTLEL